MLSLRDGFGISQTSGENCMCQVIVKDLFDWIRKTYIPARPLGFLEVVAAFLSGSDWRPIDAIIAQWHPDQPNEWENCMYQVIVTDLFDWI
jgi:hypothetical protein